MEVDIKEAWNREYQFLMCAENVTAQVAWSGQTNPNHAALGQKIGLDQETFASLAQVAIGRVDFL